MLGARIEKSRVAAAYRKIALSYDLWAWLTESKARDRWLELADIQDGENVLEVVERIYRINPALLGGCRGVLLLPQLEACGFVQIRREYLSQFTFPSKIICAKTGGSI